MTEISRCETCIEETDESSNKATAELLTMKSSGESEIVKFFEGCNVLVTGGSGFIGKILIEKLLRCCPGISTLFILIRPKKGKSSKERFSEIFDDDLFNRLSKQVPNYKSVVKMVQGDIAELGFGISEEDRELLQTSNIVFHGAATVRFDEPISKAAHINVRGTKQMLQLAKQMRDLKAFVHISTAFSQCAYKVIHEKFYKPPIDSDKLLALIDILDDETLELIVPKLLGKWPNTYTFSKAVGEHAVQKYSTGLPVCIVRPSIVISTADEPLPGWSNNLYGATGVVVGAAIGLLRTLNCDENDFAEIIPGDYVINTIIAAAWDVGQTRNIKSIEVSADSAHLEIEEPTIYNSVSTDNQITWGQFMKYNEEAGYTVPSSRCIWYYCFRLDKNIWVHKFNILLLHLIPAIIVDGVSMAVGRKPRLWKAYKKVHKFSKVITYFSSQPWILKNDSVTKLWDKLSPADRQVFYFDLKMLDWKKYMYDHMRGLRVYLIKDPLSTVEKGIIHYQRLKILHYALVTIFRIFMLWLLYKLFLYIFL